MKTYGIREAKSHLSEIVRDAGSGECSIVTDNRKPVAMIGTLAIDVATTKDTPQPAEETNALSNAAAFRKALFSAPYPLELDF